MFIKKKKNRSGTTSVVVVEKNGQKYKEHLTVGISSEETEIDALVKQGQQSLEYGKNHNYYPNKNAPKQTNLIKNHDYETTPKNRNTF